MTPEYDTFESGIGIGVYASQKGPVDSIKESSPIAINGVALPENTVLEGGQRVRHFYPPEMAKRAAEVLQQQLDDPNQTIHIVKNFHELEGQAQADDIIGEVTSVGYEKGVGVRFGGEITDKEIAEKINFGYLNISPTIARALGKEMDPQMEARAVTDVTGFRDIAVVGHGQRGADVEVGANPAIEALARSAMPGQIDVYEVSEPDYEGYSASEWDAPTLEGTFGGDMDAARNSATWVDGEGEDFEDLSLFVVDGDGACNVNALDSAWRLAAQTDGPTEDDVARLRSMYADLATDAHEAGEIGQEMFEETWVPRMEDEDEDETDTNSAETDPAESGADTDTDSATSQHDDGATAEPPSSAAKPTETMSDNDPELTDEQRALLAAADNVEDATDVLNAYAAAEQPAIVEKDTLEQHQDNLAELTQVFRDALSRQKDLPDAVVADLGVDALTAAFRDDEGDIDLDTLHQSSETQTTAGNEPDDGDTTPTADGFDPDALSLSDREELKRLKMKRTTFKNRGMDKRADTLSAEIAEKAGVDDANDIDWEVL